MLPTPSTTQRSRPHVSNLLNSARSTLGRAIQSSPNSLGFGNGSKLSTTNDEGTNLIAQFMPSAKTAAFVLSCLAWYFASALSSNTSKALLSSSKKVSPTHAAPFPYPVTLTLIQFVFIHLLSSAVASPTFMAYVPGKRKPVTRIVANPGWKRILDMAKLSVFNVVGHALSTVAISRVPVSTVHTIKALTPLFTVLSFRYVFGVHYSFMAYFSLVPLTLGVMMACTSLSFSANDLVGLITALASTFIFVAQSIYSKNLVGRGSMEKGKDSFPADNKEAKLDKINILYYTSACSIGIMIPMALYYDGAKMFFGTNDETKLASNVSTFYIFTMISANGIVQFAQNFLAFSVLALVSPVTYSIASLFKRVFVICFAIVWFGQSVSILQWLGIILTFIGLYIYNDAKSSKSIAKAEEKMELDERKKEMVLPLTAKGAAWLDSSSNEKEDHSRAGGSSSAAAKQTGFNIYAAHHQHTPMSNQIVDHTMVNTSIAPAAPKSINSAPPHNMTFMHDPRRSIPSPPPSRGPSSDDEGVGGMGGLGLGMGNGKKSNR